MPIPTNFTIVQSAGQPRVDVGLDKVYLQLSYAGRDFSGSIEIEVNPAQNESQQRAAAKAALAAHLTQLTGRTFVSGDIFWP